MIGLALLLATLGLVAHNAPPVLHTPAEVAAHAHCDVDRIAYDIGQTITWERQGNNWDSAAMCLHRKTGDCKCFAQTAAEVLRICDYPEVRILYLERGEGPGHVVTAYQDAKGNRGYIEEGYAHKFERGTPWEDIAATVGNGTWEIKK